MPFIQIVFAFALFNGTFTQNVGWRGIVPLHSTRQDVERLLGAAVRPCKEGCNYNTATEGVFVRYSGEPCEQGEANRWQVPRDTVISLDVYPVLDQKWSSLNLDKKKFKKTHDPELHGYYTYESEEDGVAYKVSDNGLVMGVNWFGSSKDSKALHCSSVIRAIATGNMQSQAFDRERSGMTFGEDKFRLDRLALRLKNSLNSKGYVIAYGSEHGLAGQARARLNCIRKYLTKAHHIKSSRLITIDGGYRSDISVELFIVGANDAIPKPMPTRHPVAVLAVPPRTNPCR